MDPKKFLEKLQEVAELEWVNTDGTRKYDQDKPSTFKLHKIHPRPCEFGYSEKGCRVDISYRLYNKTRYRCDSCRVCKKVFLANGEIIKPTRYELNNMGFYLATKYNRNK